MKIGFDISQTGFHKAGCGYLAHALIDALSRRDQTNDYLLYTNFGDDFWDPDHARGTYQRRAPNLSRRFADFDRRQAQTFWTRPGADLVEPLGRPDVVHSNNYFCPPPLPGARLVYTLYDLSFLVHPDYTTEANRLVCFNGVFRAALHADAIVAISDYSRRHFLRQFPHFPEANVHVIYPASRFADNAAETGSPVPDLVPDQFWLSVGTLEPRKNLRRLLQAYAQLRQAGQTTLPLVLAGGRGWLEEGLEAYIAELGISDDVHLLGYVDDARLRWLYAHCFAFVYPSLFEGFGLPVVEAMSLGAAVITSNSTSLPEVCGDAGLMVDPENVAELAAAMRALEQESGQRAELRRRARPQAARFAWDKAAAQVLALYESLA